ncbi:hypothetical protein DUI87_18114 [Hirundo rustica rustica]|uniref:Uncharacterized protein n=1 Tax=Hirundo rustica rustica TaxID=333673 RepID=A0A3M0JVS6_HIRRU|nr:hypothetical protein DUI87_18114 [Hirundo rustica rustica]
MEILTTSDMKNRQLRASLSTTLGIIHKLLVVICAVYCNAFPCNFSAQSCSFLVSLQHHPYRSRSEEQRREEKRREREEKRREEREKRREEKEKRREEKRREEKRREEKRREEREEEEREEREERSF